MNTVIEGVVERFAPNLCQHEFHGFHILLIGDDTVYLFENALKAYFDPDASPYKWGGWDSNNAILAELTSPGDMIRFEILGNYKSTTQRAINGTLRNWTLETRLSGVEKDVSPHHKLIGKA